MNIGADIKVNVTSNLLVRRYFPVCETKQNVTSP